MDRHPAGFPVSAVGPKIILPAAQDLSVGAARTAFPLAEAVLAKMVLGLRWNPAWQAQQAQTNARVTEINRQTHEAISGIINATRWKPEDCSNDRRRESTPAAWVPSSRGALSGP